MVDVFRLDESHAIAIQWLGERAYYLSQLAHKNYPILPGIVISAGVFRDFWQNTPWQDPLFAELSDATLHLQTEEMRQIQTIAQRLRTRVLDAQLPNRWLEGLVTEVATLSDTPLVFHPSLYIDRTPATTTPTLLATDLAALLDSQIAKSDERSLGQAVQRTWAELFRAKSLLSWQRAGITLDRLYLAILIQPLSSAIASGHLNLRTHHFEVTANSGLPPSLAEGYLVPDRYRIGSETGTVLAYDPGNLLDCDRVDLASAEIPTAEVSAEVSQPPHLNPPVLETLVRQARALHQDFGAQTDAEWTISPLSPHEKAHWCITQLYPGGATSLQLPGPPSPPPRHTPPEALVGIAASDGQCIAAVRQLNSHNDSPADETTSYILVAHQLEPQDLAALQGAVGLVLEGGSQTSHGSILARELGIPAVVGVPGATHRLQNGQMIRLDGDRGVINLKVSAEIAKPFAAQPSLRPTETSIPLRATQLTLSLSQPHLASQHSQLPVDGVGLIRSELLAVAALQGKSPLQYLRDGNAEEPIQRLAEALTTIASAFAPRPVYYRSFDGQQSGRSLSLRGTLAYTRDASIFDLEVAALARVRQSGLHNLHLILPFVRSLAEWTQARSRIQQQGLQPSSDFHLWLMAEVPSVLFLLEDYVRAGVTGIAIGLHDFTQLMLGIDRDDAEVAEAFDPLHPAVLQAIAHLAKTARRLRIPCVICADSLTGRDFIEPLVRCGVTGICLNPQTVSLASQTIAQAEHRLLLEWGWQQRDRLDD